MAEHAAKYVQHVRRGSIPALARMTTRGSPHGHGPAPPGSKLSGESGAGGVTGQRFRRLKLRSVFDRCGVNDTSKAAAVQPWTTCMTQPIHIAAAQYPIERFADLRGYAGKLGRWVGEAARAGAQLLVFPEYGAMEYAGAAGADAETLAGSLAAAADGMAQMVEVHADLARKHGIYILSASGPCRSAGGIYTNRARLFAPSGEHGVQDKLIMTPFEQSWGISSGHDLTVFETALGRIGIAICYDSEFPLLVHALCAAGADIILIPSCTEFISGYHRVRTAALARALENTCVTVQSPTVGDAPWSPAVDHNRGAAGIFVPAEKGLSDTGVLAEGAPGITQWVHAKVDLARLHALRTGGEMRNVQDWRRQPGVAAAQPSVARVRLD
jgi:predicted amidohydrolase